MKYPLPNKRVGVIQGDQETTRKCYAESIKLKRTHASGGITKRMSLRIMPPGEAYMDEKHPL